MALYMHYKSCWIDQLQANNKKTFPLASVYPQPE